MEYFLEVPNAQQVVDFFNANDSVYDEFFIVTTDNTTIQILFLGDVLSVEEKEEWMQEIKRITFNTDKIFK